MAGEWIKMEKATPDKPEVIAIASRLGIDPDAAFGKLFRVWCWFDSHTIDGNAVGVTYAFLDRIAGVTGFAEQMALAGWLNENGSALSLPNFDYHNGESAKKRAVTQKRVANHRDKLKRNSNDDVTPNALQKALPEKRREEVKTTSPKGDFSAGFQRFWESWPASERKVAKAKCAECWKRFGLDSMADAVVAHVVVMRQSEQWQKGFEPAPLTYLNQRRWQDAADAPAKPREVFT